MALKQEIYLSHEIQNHNRPSPIKRSAVSTRAVFAGLVISILMCALLPYNDYYIAATYLSGNFFPISALFGMLLIVLLVNPLLIAVGRRDKIWTPAEIMTVWTMILVVVGIPSSGLMRYLIPHLVAPHYYANSTNGWEEKIISHLPKYLFVDDKVAVTGFFEGLHRGQSIPWGAWAVPLMWWGLFVALIFLAFFCLSTIVRRQWVENEKFSFPLVQLPVQLAESPEPGHAFNTLLRSRMLWVAVLIVTCVHTAKGLHLFVPTVPDIPLVWHTQDLGLTLPWSSINDIQIAIYPLIIGFAYLLSSEVCLSLWLFYLIFKGQVLLAGMYNWDLSTTGVGYSMGPAFVTYHETGGVLMMGVWLIYSMRKHLRDVCRKAFRNASDVDDSTEPMSYKFALFGGIGSFAGLFLWLTLAAGVQPLMALTVLAGAFIVFVMLSWLVAQAGLLFVTHTFVASQITTIITGSSPFSAQTMTMASIAEHVGWQDPREFMMPSLLNSYQGASDTNLSMRSLTKALVLCVIVSTVVSAVSSIWLPYTHGGGTSMKNPFTYITCPQLSFRWTANRLTSPQAVSMSGIGHMAGGAVFVLILFLCRTWVPSFPIHPAGFVVASSWAMYMLWFSLFLGWMIKAPVMRYGGIKLYRMLLPFFLGLILGDCMNAILWTAIGLITKNGYVLLPN